jgi:hypothetical protein
VKTILSVMVLVSAVPVLAAPKRVICETTDGAVPGRKVTIDFEQPVGTKFKGEKTCGFEFSAPMSIAMVNVIHQDDAGPERLLNEKDDGAQKWVLKLSGGSLKPVASEKHSLNGESETLYRLAGEFHGATDAEVLVARVKSGKHNIVFMAQYPAKEAAKLRSAVLQVFVSAVVTISPN